MLIAKVNGTEIQEIGHYQALFPNTSFSDLGPNDDWYTENNCMRVSFYIGYDPATEWLETVEPYISNGMVYTVKAVPQPTANT